MDLEVGVFVWVNRWVWEGLGACEGSDKGSRHYLQYVNEFANGENPVRL